MDPVEVSRWAVGRGWTLEHVASRDPGLPQFEVFGLGHTRRGLLTVRGGLDIGGWTCEVTCGEYRHEVLSTTGKRVTNEHHRFCYLYVTLPVRTPDLLIRREGFLDRIGHAVGLGDIRVGQAEFDRAFVVRSSSERFAREVLSPRAVEHLLAHRPERFDLRNGSVLYHDRRGGWTTADFDRCVSEFSGLVGLWPEAVFTFV